MADETKAAEWTDEDGYPTEAALERIATWPHNDYSGLLDFAGSLWRWPDWWTRTGDTVYAATGGWSGNEDVINALKQNEVFWMQCWRYTLVGGGFGFKLPWQPGTPIRRAEDELADRAIRERIAKLTPADIVDAATTISDIVIAGTYGDDVQPEVARKVMDELVALLAPTTEEPKG